MASAASRALLLSRGLQAGAASRSVTTLLVRPLAAATSLLSAGAAAQPGAGVRCFSTQLKASLPPDSPPNWLRPPKETIVLDGCDFEHWLVVMEPPPGDASNPDVPRDEIIDSYIKTLALVVGSEEEARRKIYSVSTRHYFAFGALVSEELSYRLKELPKVRWVLADSYMDVKNKDYGGESFINGEAVSYDPIYHREWVRNNTRRRRSHQGGGNRGYPYGSPGYQGQGRDSDDQGEDSGSDDISESDGGSDSDDSDDGNDSNDSNDGRDLDGLDDGSDPNASNDGSDLGDRSNSNAQTTRTTEATTTTRTTEATTTMEASRMTKVTRTTWTREATTRTTEAARTTKPKEATRTTEVTRTTKAKEVTQTIDCQGQGSDSGNQ